MALEGLQLGRYRLLSILGSGGMGEVYLGEDAHIHRQIAIKMVRTEPSSYPDTDAIRDAERLFRREIRTIATLDHPHILPLLDYGEETVHDITYTYIVMPLREEGSLAQWLRQHNTAHLLSWPQVAHIIGQAASALHYAHRRQIIHQDVKPSNFLVRSTEEQPDLPDLALADFGIVKFYTSTASVSQISRGTPAYMAPEQWSGRPVPATDQYALAVMAYLLLVGSLPFQGRQEQIMYQHLEVQPQPPSKLNSALPTDVDTVLLHALAKKPKERFATIAAFARALRQALQSTATVQLPRPKNGRRLSGAPDTPPEKQAPPDTATVQLPHAGNGTSQSLPEAARPLPEKAEAPVKNLRATLAISETEAAGGIKRTLMLPGGRKVAITIPANVPDGHIIQFKDQEAGRERILTVTIAIKRTEEEHTPPDASEEHGTGEDNTDLSDHAQTASAPLLQYSNLVARVKSISRYRTALIVGLVLLVVLGSAGTFYFRNFNYIQRAILLNETVKNPYTSPGGTLVLNDPLSNNSNGYFWGEVAATEGSCAFMASSYHAIVPVQNHTVECYAANTSFANFTYQVQLIILKGDCGGIILRADNTYSNFYFFSICQDGSYGLSKYANSKFQHLWNNSSVLRSKAASPVYQGINMSNTIAVTADNTTITLYINQYKVTQIDDSSYKQGQIGVTADSITTPTEVMFSNAQVWTF